MIYTVHTFLFLALNYFIRSPSILFKAIVYKYLKSWLLLIYTSFQFHDCTMYLNESKRNHQTKKNHLNFFCNSTNNFNKIFLILKLQSS